jgi:formimidoylglutamase
MTALQPPTFEWVGPSDDPNDEQFGDIVEPATLDSADRYDAVLVGEPYDGAVIGRRGAAAAPAAIREALAGVKTHHVETGPVSNVGDLGTVAPPEGDVRTVQRAVREVAASVHGADAFPAFLGGDNSLTYANAGPLLEAEGSLGVVNLDAHLDVREERADATSGTPYRQLLEAGLDAYACVGARHFETSTTYHDYVHDRGGAVVTAGAVGADPDAAADRALAAMGDVDRVYLSLDCDVLDAAAAPGVSAPTPGGLTTRECFGLLGRLAADDRVVGFEVLECAPPLDRDGLTVDAAARAVAHVLAARRVGGAS